jgi:aspartate racemase
MAMNRYARVGILGGMGPAATADFYAKLVRATPAERDQDHIPVIVEADPTIPDRTQAFLHGGPSPLPHLLRGAQALQQRGAQWIAMPCNTAHLWFEEIAARVAVPMLHIVDAVVEEVLEQLGAEAAPRVAVLATAATARGTLYPRRAAADARTRRWSWVLPSGEEQAWLEEGIAAVKGGDIECGRALMASVVTALSGNVDAIVYACTEVPIAMEGSSVPGRVVDSTAALARMASRVSRGAPPPPPSPRGGGSSIATYRTIC